MKIISEYVFASMFYLASGFSFYIGSQGAGMVLACLGAYFPTREFINEIVFAIKDWKINNMMKVIWTVFAGVCLMCGIGLITFNFQGFLGGFLGVCMLSMFNTINEKNSQ